MANIGSLFGFGGPPKSTGPGTNKPPKDILSAKPKNKDRVFRQVDFAQGPLRRRLNQEEIILRTKIKGSDESFKENKIRKFKLADIVKRSKDIVGKKVSKVMRDIEKEKHGFTYTDEKGQEVEVKFEGSAKEIRKRREFAHKLIPEYEVEETGPSAEQKARMIRSQMKVSELGSHKAAVHLDKKRHDKSRGEKKAVDMSQASYKRLGIEGQAYAISSEQAAKGNKEFSEDDFRDSGQASATSDKQQGAASVVQSEKTAASVGEGTGAKAKAKEDSGPEAMPAKRSGSPSIVPLSAGGGGLTGLIPGTRQHDPKYMDTDIDYVANDLIDPHSGQPLKTSMDFKKLVEERKRHDEAAANDNDSGNILPADGEADDYEDEARKAA